MCIVRQRLDDVGTRVDEVAVQLRDDVRMLEHDLGDEGSGLQVPAPFELEDVALGADDRALIEPLQQRQRLGAGCGHGESIRG